MTEVFAVFKQGVYRHECGGVFSTKDLAVAQADFLARNDYDRYHDYEVVPFNLDDAPPHVQSRWGAEIPESAVVYSVNKPRGE